MTAKCFPPIARKDAQLLILGSLPGEESLRRQQYYAQPRNAFWKIIERLFAIPQDAPFETRVQMLRENRVAVWDVCAAAARKGSLDSAIEPATIVANDFAGFFAQHPQITHVYFNGKKSEEIYRRAVLPNLKHELTYISLPSTSPAHAGLSLDAKCLRWQNAMNDFISKSHEHA